MKTYDSNLLFNYKPSNNIYKKALLVTAKLGKLNVRLKTVFKDFKSASRLFAFIESKYSSKIEGIYTTLFDVVNTGKETEQQHLIKPLVTELFKAKDNDLSLASINSLESIMNVNKDKSKRFEDDFGVYEKGNGKPVCIYKPPTNQEIINQDLKIIINKAQNDINIIEILHTHIIFEKLHPFVDANGRLGRLIMQKSIAKLMNFTTVIPLSWAIFKNQSFYYESFHISSNEDIDKGINNMFEIIFKMYKAVKQFSIKLQKWKNSNIDFIQNISRKISYELATSILLTLQTKRSYIERTYNLNVRTIDSIFDKINDQIPFNFKRVGNFVTYWNIELEEMIDQFFGG